MRAYSSCLVYEAKPIERAVTAEIPDSGVLEIYEAMVRIRAFEEALLARYERLEIRGELHLSIGQEAVAAGIISALEDRDYVVTTHRSHGHLISKGVDLRRMAAEIYGKGGGLCRGKGGHMHLTDIGNRCLTTGIVGGGIPIAAGLAFASKYLGEGSIAVAFTGDGGANQGVFHEALNISSLWRLPLLLVVEDNMYAFSTRKDRSTSVEHNAVRAASYGIRGYEILEGNDALAVRAVAEEAIGLVRKGEEPVLLEVRTYRMRPHLELVDPETYRDDGEKREWSKRDPIKVLRERILSEGIGKEEQLRAIEDKAYGEAEEALSYAAALEGPAPAEALEDLYIQEEFVEHEGREGGRVMAMYEAINEALALEMARDPRVVILGEDIARLGGAFWCTGGLLEKFGEKRVLDTPISEAGFVGLAVGAAIAGLRPVVELQMVDFSFVAMDQLLNHMAKLRYMSGGQLKVPVVVRAPIGGGYGDAAQHSQLLYSMFAHIPGLYVVAPSNPFDAKGMLTAAIRSDNPTVFLEHKLLYGVPFLPPGSFSHVPEEPYTVPIGKARVVRNGRDITIAGIAYTARLAEEAAKELEKEGVEAEVIDLRSLSPLDKGTILRSVRKTCRLLIVDEDYLPFGASGEMAAVIAEDLEALKSLKAPIVRVGNPGVPVPYAESLEKMVLPSVEKIVSRTLEVVR